MSQNDLSQVDALIDLQGATVVDPDGNKIGAVVQIWVDKVNNLPEWAAVKTRELLGSQTRYVPLRAAELGGEVVVAYTKDEVKSAPDFDSERASQDDIEALYRHYRQPLPAPPPPRVANPFDRLTAAWMPGVGRRAAAVGQQFREPAE